MLDEPSIGLHSRDTHRLIKILHDLRDLGNTILVVEHDRDVMRASDTILDLGPGAGENGGKVIAAGTYDQIQKMPGSLTGRYLSEELRIQIPSVAAQARTAADQNLRGARAQPEKYRPRRSAADAGGHHRRLRVGKIHAAARRAVPGAVSGQEAAQRRSRRCFLWDRVEGAEFIDEVVLVDQSPIGRTPRSNPVTYIKAFDGIRDLFASLPEAKKRGFTAGHFSFNIPGGRCETCQGDGTVTVEMQFLADVELICEECKGARYKPQVLEVRYRGKNIHEVLNLTVKEALQFFCRRAQDCGETARAGGSRSGVSAPGAVGHHALGRRGAAHETGGAPAAGGARQPAVQRTAEDGSRRKRRILYIFDEPTTGLHFDDISKLLSAFRRLIDAGGSILVIEHNLEVIKTADWVIDLGPEGGERGGYIVGSGPPEAIAKLPKSYTGKFLAGILNGNGSSRNGAQISESALALLVLGLLPRWDCPSPRAPARPSVTTKSPSRTRPSRRNSHKPRARSRNTTTHPLNRY